MRDQNILKCLQHLTGNAPLKHTPCSNISRRPNRDGNYAGKRDQWRDRQGKQRLRAMRRSRWGIYSSKLEEIFSGLATEEEVERRK